MGGVQLVLAHGVKVALLGLLFAIILRGRLRQCWAFPPYLLAILVGNALASISPSRFYTGWFFVYKQGAYDVLKMAIALELAYRTLRAFPGAWRTARVMLLVVLTASTFVLATLTPRSSYGRLWEWQPSVVTATVWLLTATALLVVWYRVPVRDWQRAILLGLAPYLLANVTLMDILRRRGWELRAEVGVLDSLAYLLLILYWTFAAWRRSGASDRAMDALDHTVKGR